jgi:hypothetical protein
LGNALPSHLKSSFMIAGWRADRRASLFLLGAIWWGDGRGSGTSKSVGRMSKRFIQREYCQGRSIDRRRSNRARGLAFDDVGRHPRAPGSDRPRLVRLYSTIHRGGERARLCRLGRPVQARACPRRRHRCSWSCGGACDPGAGTSRSELAATSSHRIRRIHVVRPQGTPRRATPLVGRLTRPAGRGKCTFLSSRDRGGIGRCRCGRAGFMARRAARCPDDHCRILRAWSLAAFRHSRNRYPGGQ